MRERHQHRRGRPDLHLLDAVLWPPCWQAVRPRHPRPDSVALRDDERRLQNLKRGAEVARAVRLHRPTRSAVAASEPQYALLARVVRRNRRAEQEIDHCEALEDVDPPAVDGDELAVMVRAQAEAEIRAASSDSAGV